MPENATSCSTRSKHREDLYQNKNPADLEVNKYMKLKMIICI